MGIHRQSPGLNRGFRRNCLEYRLSFLSLEKSTCFEEDGSTSGDLLSWISSRSTILLPSDNIPVTTKWAKKEARPERTSGRPCGRTMVSKRWHKSLPAH